MANIANLLGGAFVPPAERYIAPPEDQLRSAMQDAGIEPPEQLILDGKLRRFRSGTKGQGGHGDKTGWYVCFSDGIPAGRFGCWRAGVEVTFKANVGRKLDMHEEMAIQRRISEAKKQREIEEKKSREVASDTVSTIWSGALHAVEDHPYLKRKGIQPNGSRVTGDGRLIVPLFNDDGSLSTLQYISEDGDKKYHPGGATGGKFNIIGTIEDAKRIYIAEGFATAATIYEVTGHPCIAAYSASNLVPIAGRFKELMGAMTDIVIVADHDASGVGMRYAEQASAKYGVRVIIPPELGDANDYHIAGGDLNLLLNPTTTGQMQKLGVVFGDELGDEYQAPDELVEGLITKGSAVVIYGDSNSGKTFLALSIAASISNGDQCFGRQTEKGLVIYLACEAPGSIRTRMQALKKHHGYSLENMAIVPVPLNFYSGEGDAQSVIELVKEVEDRKGLKVSLIIGDTLARMAAGANENSGEDMGPVMARFDRVAHATGAAMMIIHHNGKNAAAGARGWSGIRAHIDTEIEVAETNGVRCASVTKQRELPSKGEDIYFKLEVIEMGETKFGNTATTCVAVHDPDGEQTPKEQKKDSDHNQQKKRFERAWFASGAELSIGNPYVSRSALLNFLVNNDGVKQSSAEQICKPTGKLIGSLLNSSVIQAHKDGWVISCDFWASSLLIQTA